MDPCNHDEIELFFEEQFEYYVENLSKSLPDGIINVNLAFIESQDYFTSLRNEYKNLAFYWTTDEEKTTLYNEKFVIWVIPKRYSSYILIALNCPSSPVLQVVLFISGIYHCSEIRYKSIVHQLQQIQDTETALKTLCSSHFNQGESDATCSS